MKNIILPTVQVNGRLDSLTDILKQLLFQYEPQTIKELIPQVQGRLATMQSAAKLEKNVLRCLQKNPAFRKDAQGLWFLNLGGQRENSPIHQVLENALKPLSLQELNSILKKTDNQEKINEEKRMVQDARFIRLKSGKWALVYWEIVREISDRELEQVGKVLREVGHPLSLAELAEKVLNGSWEDTNLYEKLQQDERFRWVGGSNWFLKDLIPHPVLEPEVTNTFSFLRQAETAALQGAELMLTFQDTDPNIRNYIVSSQDLKSGCLRITKRMDKLFNVLPAEALITFRTQSGPLKAWYYQGYRLICGLLAWFEQQNVMVGTRLEIRKVDENQALYDLVATSIREEEVYAEARRLEKLELLRQQDQWEQPWEELFVSILELFPEGLDFETLKQIVVAIRSEELPDIRNLLRRYPYFEEIVEGSWCFNHTMKNAYDQMQQELRETQSLLVSARAEAAASHEETEMLASINEDLDLKVKYLEQKYLKEEKSLEEQVNNLLIAEARLQQENTQLRSELEKLHRRKEQLRVELSANEEEVSNLRMEKDTMASRIDQLEGRVLQLQGSLNNVLSKGQTEQASLKQKLKETEKRMQGILLANQDLQRTISLLQEECLELRRRTAPWLVRLAITLVGAFGRKSVTPRQYRTKNKSLTN
jgi:phage shock protein A